MSQPLRSIRPELDELRLLVVDDERMSRQLCRTVVAGLGCDIVDVAENGQVALDLMATTPSRYHVVVSDLKMPTLNGLELLKAIRVGAPGVARDTRFAMLTAYSDRNIVGAAFRLDVDGFIVKPISAEQMGKRLVRILRSERPINEPDHYRAVDTSIAIDGDDALETPGDRISVSALRPKRPKARPAGDGASVAKSYAMEKTIGEIRGGVVLAESVHTSNGQKLLSEGEILTPRIIDRLRDLAELDPRFGRVVVWVEPE